MKAKYMAFALGLLCITVFSAIGQESGYQLNGEHGVIRLSDGAAVPSTAGNRDWKEYQEWLGAGGIPRPAPPVSLRKPIWNGAQWTEGEDPAESAARINRNTIRARLRADRADPGARGGMPELAAKVDDIIEILHSKGLLVDEEVAP